MGRVIINYQLGRFGFPNIIIRDKEKRKAIIGAASPDEVYRLLENT